MSCIRRPPQPGHRRKAGDFPRENIIIFNVVRISHSEKCVTLARSVPVFGFQRIEARPRRNIGKRATVKWCSPWPLSSSYLRLLCEVLTERTLEKQWHFRERILISSCLKASIWIVQECLIAWTSVAGPDSKSIFESKGKQRNNVSNCYWLFRWGFSGWWNIAKPKISLWLKCQRPSAPAQWTVMGGQRCKHPSQWPHYCNKFDQF